MSAKARETFRRLKIQYLAVRGSGPHQRSMAIRLRTLSRMGWEQVARYHPDWEASLPGSLADMAAALWDVEGVRVGSSGIKVMNEAGTTSLLIMRRGDTWLWKIGAVSGDMAKWTELQGLLRLLGRVDRDD